MKSNYEKFDLIRPCPGLLDKKISINISDGVARSLNFCLNIKKF